MITLSCVLLLPFRIPVRLLLLHLQEPDFTVVDEAAAVEYNLLMPASTAFLPMTSFQAMQLLQHHCVLKLSFTSF
jgi:hypothetical protein